jgi:ribosomal protein L11 methyltransferase
MSVSWLEVALVVDGELAEAVAEVLARFAPNGVVIESTAVTAEADDSQGHAIGPLRVSAYLAIDERLEETRQKLEESLWYLGRIQPLPAASFRTVEETNWAEAWKVHYRPISIGKNLVIVPAWLENPDQSRVAIRIDPGMAFGTGTHPTTQLCLELIEYFYRSKTSTGAVIDIGCGSGILTIAALKLGAQYGLGVDIDPEAVAASRENAVLNGVEGRLELSLGSLSDVRSGDHSIAQAPLVLANILAPVLVSLLDEGLGELTSPDGWLVLSGILAEQSTSVEAALQKNGLELVEKRQIGDWVALAATR